MAQQDYTTPDEVKIYLGLASTDESKSALIQLLIRKAMAFIDSYTGRTFGWGNPDDPSDLTNFKDVTTIQGNVDGEVHDGLYGTKIYLRNMDIALIDSVKVGNPDIGPQTTLDPTQYLWRDDGRLLLGGNWFDSTAFPTGGDNQSFYGLVGGGYQTLYIKYHYGYRGVPEDIGLACLDLVSNLQILRKSQGIAAERIGDYSINYDQNLRVSLAKQPDVLRILGGYRRVKL